MAPRLRTSEAIRAELRDRIPLRYLPEPRRETMEPTWRAARPGRIATALDRALARPAGGWYVVGASHELGVGQSVARVVAGREVTLWRDAGGAPHAGPGACPHLGALLDRCEVTSDRVVCPWHGLALGEDTGSWWPTHAAYDDGHLLWVRLTGTGGPRPHAEPQEQDQHAEPQERDQHGEPHEQDQQGEQPTERPVVPARPGTDGTPTIGAVVAVRGRCEPRDILANRLDPWHGAWYHPYAFSHLRVDEAASDDDVLVLDVAYRVAGPLAVPVRAEFRCPDRRTIVMTIVEGEGAGSVVETHATPLTPPGSPAPVTVMSELTLAGSPRRGFAVTAGIAPLTRLIRAGMRASAGRLWVDDIAYAQRRYETRAMRRDVTQRAAGIRAATDRG